MPRTPLALIPRRADLPAESPLALEELVRLARRRARRPRPARTRNRPPSRRPLALAPHLRDGGRAAIRPPPPRSGLEPKYLFIF